MFGIFKRLNALEREQSVLKTKYFALVNKVAALEMEMAVEDVRKTVAATQKLCNGSIVDVGTGTIKPTNPEDFKKAQFKTEIKVQPKAKTSPASKRKPTAKKKATK